MAYSAIEQIKVGNNPNGQAFGGYIFNATMSIGFNASPTEINLSIANADGEYRISETDLKLNATPTLITLGDLRMRMFPVKYNIQKNLGERVLTVKYVDLSKALDRIFVGLLNEHTRRNVKPLYLQADVPVSCPSCDGTPYNRQLTYNAKRNVDSLGLDGTIQQLKRKKIGFTRIVTTYYKTSDSNLVPSLTIVKKDPNFDPTNAAYQYEINEQPRINNTLAPDTISGYTAITSSIVREFVSYFDIVPVSTNLTNPPLIIGNLTDGGFIGLGTEEFNQSSCGTGPVSYSLKELKNAIRQMGIDIFKVANIDSIPDGSNQIRRNYTGSLRSVLDSWGREYGFTFTYDLENHKIIGIDLRTPIVDLTDIKNAVRTIDNVSTDTTIANSAIIESFDEEVSIEETYRKYHATTYKRDRTIKNFNQTIYNKAYFSRLTLADVMSVPNGFETLSDPYNNLYVACVLARTFNYDVWRDYMLYGTSVNILQKWGDLINGLALPASSDEKYQHIAKSLGLSLSDYDVQLLKTSETAGAQSDYLTTWFINEIYETHKSIGEYFINKFYTNTDYEPFRSQCCRETIKFEVDAGFQSDIETIHSTTAFVQDCQTAPSLSTASSFPASPPRSYFSIFGHYQNLLKTTQTIINEKYGFQSTGIRAFNIYNRQGNYRLLVDLLDVSPSVNQGGYTVSDNMAQSVIHEQINYIVKTNNVKTFALNINTRINGNEQLIRPESSSYECNLICEEDIVGQACNAARCVGAGQRIDKAWEEGLLSQNCDEIVVNLTKNRPSDITRPTSIRVLSPSNGSVLLNFIYRQNSSYVIPGTKQVKEKLDVLPGNVANIDFGVFDATSDLDAYYNNDGSVVTNVFVPETINGSHIVTIDQYDAKIRENESIVEVNVDKPRKAIQFTVPGVLPRNKILVNGESILSPAKGLNAIDISWGDKGVTSTYKFATRPPMLPAAQKELTFNRVGVKQIL